MAKFVKHREMVESVSYARFYGWRSDPNAGFSFESDSNGVVLVNRLQPAALENYQKCLSGEYDVIDQGVHVFTHRYAEPAVIECNICGEQVELHNFTNTCHNCYTDYNMSGQQLSSRECWGEETGEHWTDCV